MLVKDKYLEKIKSYIIFLVCILFVTNIYAQNITNELNRYNYELKNSSMSFIQSDGITLEEGKIYIGEERIRVDYFIPNKITIVLSKNKGMYLNHDLEEAQYFKTGKTFVKFFFEIFSEEIFFKNVEFVEIQNTINVFKKVILDEKTYSIKIIYENNPIKIRKIYIDGDDAGFEIGFYEFSKGEFYNKDFYSLVNPYLKN
tara:strand:- start:1268 stop:1867 length:600 start_codon:yes stop_codon:yes gene_type:complete